MKTHMRLAFLLPIVLVLTLHIWPFLSGFRLTPDDVTAHFIGMGGAEKLHGYAIGLATGQGRIGHFLVAPVAVFASYYADHLGFRTLYTVFHFSTLALFAYYISIVLRLRLSIILFILMLSIYPLDYFHLPPTSYPFHVSLPVSLVLVSKLGRLKSRRTFSGTIWWWIAGLVGCLYTEGGLTFFIAVTLFELLCGRANKAQTDSSFGDVPRRLLPYSFELTIGIAYLVLYLGFKYFYPSQYNGNQLSTASSIGGFFRTLIGHLYGGTSFASLSRSSGSIFEYSISLTPGPVIASISILMSVFAIFYKELVQLIADKRADSEDSGYLRPIIAAIGGAFIVTAPIAAVPKYQGWCERLDACVYHDSRLSFYFVALVLCLMLSVATRVFGGTEPMQRLGVLLVTGLVSCLSVTTFLNNHRMSQDMLSYVRGWKVARALACSETKPILNASTANRIDPLSRVLMHPSEVVRADYWNTYMRTIRANRDQQCTGIDVKEANILDRASLPVGNVDLPRPKEIIQKTLQVSGWVVTEEPVSEVSVYIDSAFVTTVPFGLARPDIAIAKPGYKNAPTSGFGGSIDISHHGQGWHEVIVQAKTRGGSVRDLGVILVKIDR